MKTKSLFIAALMTVSSVLVFAGKDTPRTIGLVVMPVKGTEVYKLIYQGETAGRIKVNIVNAQGLVIFSDVITGLDGFIYPMNFAGLEEGEYTIQVIDANGKREEKVFHSTAKQKSTINFVRVSKLTNADGKFLMTVSNSGTDRIKVKIFDASGNLLHIENKMITGDFAQVYKLTGNSGFRFQVKDSVGNTTNVEF